jgi:hypothetical protein
VGAERVGALLRLGLELGDDLEAPLGIFLIINYN